MSFDFESAAAAMFGDAHPTQAPATPSHRPAPQSDEQRIAETLFGDTSKPAQLAKTSGRRDDRPFTDLTEDEQAARLYGPTDPALTHRDATQAITNAGMEQSLLDPDTAAEVAAEWSAVFQQHNLNSTESKDLADLGASVMHTPPTAETLAQWEQQSVEQLKADFGVTGAGQALADARAYVASVPGAAGMLDTLGLGSHPKVVAIAAARGRAMRLKGR